MIETMANNMVADFCLLCSFADVCVLDGDEISKHRCSIEGSSILINYNCLTEYFAKVINRKSD